MCFTETEQNYQYINKSGNIQVVGSSALKTNKKKCIRSADLKEEEEDTVLFLAAFKTYSLILTGSWWEISVASDQTYSDYNISNKDVFFSLSVLTLHCLNIINNIDMIEVFLWFTDLALHISVYEVFCGFKPLTNVNLPPDDGGFISLLIAFTETHTNLLKQMVFSIS